MANYDASVIIPMYNTEKYIGQCIESLLNQTRGNIEIVVVNDGSTDSSPAIVKAYAEEHDNINFVDKENGGLASARIAGIKAAHGKYIGWVDSDDFLEPDTYEVMLKLLEDNNADCAYFNLDFYPHKVANKAAWFKEYKGVIDWNFIDRNCQPSHFVVSKELLDRINLTEKMEEFGEYSWISVMLNAEKIVYTDKVYYHYRVGHDSMSGSGKNGGYKGKVAKFVNGAEVTSKLKKLLVGTPYEQELSAYFDYRYIYALLMLEIVATINSDKEAYQKAAKELKRMDFRKNKYTKLILDYNHGKLKSFVVRNVVANSYILAKAVTSLAF